MRRPDGSLTVRIDWAGDPPKIGDWLRPQPPTPHSMSRAFRIDELTLADGRLTLKLRGDSVSRAPCGATLWPWSATPRAPDA